MQYRRQYPIDFFGAGNAQFQYLVADSVVIGDVIISEFFADHTFETNNENALIEIFKKIEDPILKRRSQVSDMTWLKYSQDIINFIKQLKSYE
jgi:hypothetical protein